MGKLKNNIVFSTFLFMWLVTNFFSDGFDMSLVLLILVTALSVAISVRYLFQIRKEPNLQSSIQNKLQNISKKVFFPLYFLGYVGYAYSITKDMGIAAQISVGLIGIFTFALTCHKGQLSRSLK